MRDGATCKGVTQNHITVVILGATCRRRRIKMLLSMRRLATRRHRNTRIIPQRCHNEGQEGDRRLEGEGVNNKGRG